MPVFTAPGCVVYCFGISYFFYSGVFLTEGFSVFGGVAFLISVCFFSGGMMNLAGILDFIYSWLNKEVVDCPAEVGSWFIPVDTLSYSRFLPSLRDLRMEGASSVVYCLVGIISFWGCLPADEVRLAEGTRFALGTLFAEGTLGF